MLRTSIFYVAAWIVAVNAVAIVPRDTATCPTICVDFVNECGMKYGGCVPHCEGEPLPTFTKPVCPTPTPCPTICVDGVNACGAMFGGCVPHCQGQPFPTFSTPPCPAATSTPAS